MSLRLLADPRAVPYVGASSLPGAAASSASPTVADRISMPQKASVGTLEPSGI